MPYNQSDPYGQPALPPPMSSPPASSPPASGQPYQMPPVSGAPAAGGYDPYGQAAYAQQAGYPVAVAAAYDPLTGQPYSDKSKLAAGLLQLLPGLFFAIGGIGRLYAGNIALGVTQLILSFAVGWVAFICGWFLFAIPWVVTGGLWLWFIIDGIMMLAGRPVDGQGRPLRPN
ncbi:TM2 domain-containing protein [Dactylosporangium sp. CA-233914]|uniref:TM2 domain-containing protein n=1 Tax=Dactylosporangium sp. CA-233914 TaxID=3239934 RepID=UPI003D90592E